MKEALKATQPFFVLDTKEFYQEIYERQGISHFYTFCMKEKDSVIAVPDGCIDLIFEYDTTGMRAFACGTVLKCKNVFWNHTKNVFGVRFFPGYQPAGISVTQKDLVEKEIPLEDILPDKRLLTLLSGEQEFYQRIRIFLQEYTKFEKKAEKPFGKKELVLAVKNLVYVSGGLIRISKLQELTGYSERYINKVFIEQMGYSPKTFCKIIQFQKALEYLNYGVPDSMTKAATDLGYYDQPQFIHDFKKFCGITPGEYLKMIQSRKYCERVRNLHNPQIEEIWYQKDNDVI